MFIRAIHSRFLALALLSLIVGQAANGQAQQPAQPSGEVELKLSESGLSLARAKESFSSLSLEGSDLQPRPPLQGGGGESPQFGRELWRLQWRPNDPIDLYVIRPPGAKKPPVVLYLYGFPSELDRFRDDRYCQRLVKNGAAAVGFLSAYTGRRAEEGPLNKWFISQLPESLAMTVHDVHLILDYLATRGDLDMRRVGMFGQGSGGAIAILAAAADSRLRAIDLLNPWGDWPDWLATSAIVPKEERERYLKPDFLKTVESLEPVRYLPTLRSCAIRIQFWEDENSATKEAAAKLEAAAPANAKVLHYPNGHAMYAVSSNGRLFEWLATELKSATETKARTAQTRLAASAR